MAQRQAQDFIPIRVEIDLESNLELKRWSDSEGRGSKRRMIAILIRKLTRLRKTNPIELQRLGLSEI